MHNPTLTTVTSLNVDHVPIVIVSLTTDGLLPQRLPEASASAAPTELHVSRHLPPSNRTEEILLSVWLNTHQAMFLSTGIAADCVLNVVRLLTDSRPLGEIQEYVALAAQCRLASAAYTSLPLLTKPLYEGYLRESMVRVHPGFSGVSNREAITMERSLRELKRAQASLGLTHKSRAERLVPELEKIYAADRYWWKFHGMAMRNLVESPESLARMDFKHRVEEGEEGDFRSYRDRVLREDGALSDYDSYFAVKRSDTLTLGDYRNALADSLARSTPYVRHDGELAEHRERGEVALNRAIDLSETRLR